MGLFSKPAHSTRPAATQSIGDKHVLVWYPPAIAGEELWELMPRAVFDELPSRRPGRRARMAFSGPADAPPAGLAAVVADMLGYDVQLTAGSLQVRPGHDRVWARWIRSPLYYVSPAVVA